MSIVREGIWYNR